jgi:hypothetical protein
MNNIILFATYWNEIEWIESSLEQMLKIDPVEIIICDGNFDPKIENRSTDGTYEVIKKFVDENSERAKMISAVRVKGTFPGWEFFNNAGTPKSSKFNLGRFITALKCQFRINEYRVNQALTFAKMTQISKKWKPDSWVMSYDADQFYTDDLIDFFKITNRDTNFDLITADEYTFPYDFNNYTDSYELRKWNNMPHKIKPNMAVYPTRHFVVESMFGFKYFYENCKNIFGGIYHHYKFRKDIDRLNSGYKLGDRKKPNNKRFAELKYSNKELLPSIIKKNYKKDL